MMLIYIDSVSVKQINAGDATPNRNNGANYGATYTTDRNGQSNKAMSFDGTTDYINIDGVVNTVQNDTQGTWSAWVKPTDGQPAASGTILSLGDTSACEYLRIHNNTDGTISLRAAKAGTVQFNLATDAAVWADAESTWRNIVVVQNGTSPVIYINGVAVAQTFSISTDVTAWMSDLTLLDNSTIGDTNTCGLGGSVWFTGSMFDVRIYNYALTAAEVAELYGANKPIIQQSSSTKGLVGQWSLSQQDEVLGSEMLTDANAASDLNGNEVNATTGWSGTATVTSSAADPSVGTYALDVTGNAGDYLTHAVSFTSGRLYKLLYDVKVISGNGEFHVSDNVGYGWNDNRIELGYFGSGGYNTFEPYFTANATAVALNLWLTGAGTEYYVDNFSLKPVNAGDTTANGNTGTVYGATYTTDRNGQSNGAMNFDGDTYINLGGASALQFTDGDFTFATWFKVDTFHSEYNNYLISDGKAEDGEGYYIRLWNTGMVQFLVGNGAGSYTNVAPTISSTTGVWRHVAVTVDGTTKLITMYIDGVYKSSTTAASLDFTDASATYLAGSYLLSSGTGLEGDISDVRIYNRALSAAEVAELYGKNNAVLSQPSTSKGLVGQWSLGNEDEILSSNFITNGTFDADTGWSKLASATISSGVANFTADGDGIYQALTGYSWAVNQSLKIVYTLDGNAGSMYIPNNNYIDTFFDTNTYITTTDGTNILYAASTDADGAGFQINAGSFAGTLDNVSVRKVTGVQDSTPYSNNGTVYGTTYATDRKGQNNKAMSFDGTDDYIDAGNVSTFDFGNSSTDSPFSFTAWVYADSAGTGTNRVIIGAYDSPSGYQQYVGLRIGGGDKLDTELWDHSTGGKLADITDSAVSLDKWIHVAVTYDGSSSQSGITLYVDGVAPAQTQSLSGSYTAMEDSGTPLVIGRMSSGNQQYFYGKIADVRIYNRVLTAAEVTALYNSY